MAERREQKELLEQFKQGNYTPFVMNKIIDKWEKRENFTWRELYLELQQVTKTQHNPMFAQSLREALKAVVNQGMYYEIAGTYIPTKKS